MKHLSRIMMAATLASLAVTAASWAQGGSGAPGGGGSPTGGGGRTTGGGNFGGAPTGGGNVGFQGGGNTGGNTARGGTSAARSTTNFLNSTYVYPYVLNNYSQGSSGTASTTSSSGGTSSTGAAQSNNNSNAPQAAKFFNTATFGSPLYTISSTGTTGGRGGSATVRGGTSASNSTNSTDFNAGAVLNQARMPHYVVITKFKNAPEPPGQLLSDLNGLLDNAPSVPSRSKVKLAIDGRVVTLTGSVADAEERRYIEAMVRMTPGVGRVQNQLEVKP